jgi:hypothetical protein
MLQCGALDLDSEVKRAGQKVTVVRSGCGRAASDARSGTGRIVHAAPIALGPSGPSESPAGAAPPPAAAGLTRRWCKWLPFLLKNLFGKTNERVRQGATWRPGPRARLVDHERDRRSAATAASVRGHRGLGCRRRHGREPREGGRWAPHRTRRRPRPPARASRRRRRACNYLRGRCTAAGVRTLWVGDAGAGARAAAASVPAPAVRLPEQSRAARQPAAAARGMGDPGFLDFQGVKWPPEGKPGR